MDNKLYDTLAKLLADTYSVYLKTQNYHWHVKGPLFKAMHDLFELQYTELAEAVDEIAERILTLGHTAPASFGEFQALSSIKDGNKSAVANEMLKDLLNDHRQIIKDLYSAIERANDLGDEGSASLLSGRIEHHEKIAWMLSSSLES